MKIQKDSFLITQNEYIGIVYMPLKGRIKTTTPEHAKQIEDLLKMYFEGELKEDEERRFETYMFNNFEEYDDLVIEEELNILEREELEQIEIVLAKGCNLNCKYCYAQGGSYGEKNDYMSPEMAVKYLDALLAKKVRRVNKVLFFGGEPLLCPETIEAVCSYFRKNVNNGFFDKEPIYLMVSNGTLITEKIAKMCAEYQIRVTISIDGPREINDQLRVDKLGNGTFQLIEKGISLMRKSGNPPRQLEVTYTSKHDEMGYKPDEVKDYLQHYFGVDRVLLCGCGKNENGKELEYELSDEKIYDDIDIKKTFCIIKRSKIHDIRCTAGSGAFALLPNGDIFPCHFFIGYEEYRLADFNGNTFDFQNYENVLNRLELAHKIRNDRCNDCWAKTVCRACPAKILLSEYSDLENGNFCNEERQYQKTMILKCAEKYSLIE